MTLQDFTNLARRLFVRAVTADFQRQRAWDDERSVLATAPRAVVDHLAQDYIAWRRAVLWVAGVMLALGVLIASGYHESTAEQIVAAGAGGRELTEFERAHNLAQVEQTFGRANLRLVDNLIGFTLLVKVAVAVLVIVAAAYWHLLPRSRALTRWAWAGALFVPLLTWVLPWGAWLDFSHLNMNSEAVRQQVAGVLGVMMVATVAPKLLGLFPGIIRSSLTLKTLLPQAAAPGWLTVVFAPFLVGFLLLVLGFLSQVQSSWVLIIGVALLIVGPAIYVLRARDLVRAHRDEEVGEVVRAIRGRAITFNLVGALLVCLYIADLDVIAWHDALHLGLEAGGGIMLTMVAISDITLALLAYGHQQGAAFHSSELRRLHEERLQALATAGLTDVEQAFGIGGTSAVDSRPAQ